MPQRILVSGSLAYDHLYTFPGVFQNEFIANAKGALSVAFNVTDKAVNFGGCAGNIVYNAKLLGKDFIMLGIAGCDFGVYEEWLKKNKIDTAGVIVENSEYTSQATVVTDQKGQQITFFHEGAASKSGKHVKHIKAYIRGMANKTKFALVSPNNKAFMIASMEGCCECRIPFFFDPGQAMPLFKKEELLWALKASQGVFLNEYELELLKKRLGMKSNEELFGLCELVVVTLGEKGAVIYSCGKPIFVPTKRQKDVKDPTGCGDAFRAGFLIGIKDNLKPTPNVLKQAGDFGTKLALKCLKAVGTQNHKS